MKNNNLKILFLSAEVTPIAKVGGLGDVAGALPKELKTLGIDVRICLPFYGFIDKKILKAKKIKSILVPIDSKKEKAEIFETVLPNSSVPVYLIKHKFFNPDEIYLTERSQKENNYMRGLTDIVRFSFFSRACIELIKTTGFHPSIIHANDWHTGLIGDILKTLKQKETKLKKIKTIYTIHNLANQGISDPNIVKLSKINSHLKNVRNDLKNGDLNFMVQGVLSSDLVNTVSPTYAKEILTHNYGAGLEKVLILKKKSLYGILNGIDIDFYNPEKDKMIPANFSKFNLNVKEKNKRILEKKLGFTKNNLPLVAFVSRFVWQKGVDLINENFANLNCRFVFLGTGEKKYERHLKNFEKKFPKKFRTIVRFDEKLAHEIYAGADMFLVPSRFEPCGLTQMISMRYGAVPIVRATGGLKDTVNGKNGFVFKKFDSKDFYKTIESAIKVFQSKSQWQKLQLNGMKKDFSWKKPARKYLNLYNKLIS